MPKRRWGNEHFDEERYRRIDELAEKIAGLFESDEWLLAALVLRKAALLLDQGRSRRLKPEPIGRDGVRS